jgi:hypothetical protein
MILPRTALVLPLLIGCGSDGAKDTAATGTAGPIEPTCTATVDGAAWEASPEISFWASYHAGSLSISCAMADGSSGIVANVSDYTGVGTYALTDGQTYAQYLGGAMSPEPGAWVSTTGTIEITRDDGVAVEGTMSFDGMDASLGTTKVITGGVFALNEEG